MTRISRPRTLLSSLVEILVSGSHIVRVVEIGTMPDPAIEHLSARLELEYAFWRLGDIGRSDNAYTGKSTFFVCRHFERLADSARIDVLINVVHRHATQVLWHIGTRYATRVPEGANPVRTIQSEDAWLAQIVRVFPNAIRLELVSAGACLIADKPPTPQQRWRTDKLATAQEYRARWRRRRSRLAGQLWRAVRPPLPESALMARLEARHVALVGNARSLATCNHGMAIDAADVVVRCNRGAIVHTHSHGRRRDWLVTSLAIAEEDAEGIAVILWTSRSARMMRNIPAWMYRSGKLALYSNRSYRRLQADLGSLPSTGMKAIDLLVRSRCAALDLYGFDFGETNSSSEPTGSMSDLHDFAREACYVRSLAARDSRIVIHPGGPVSQ